MTGWTRAEFEEHVQFALFEIMDERDDLQAYFDQADNIEQLGGNRKELFEELS